MPIFINDNNLGLKKPICLSKDDEHHLVRVMRAKAGDEIRVTDNAGQIATAEIASTRPFTLALKHVAAGAKPLSFSVAVPLIEQERLEWAIEKLTELNVKEILLTITERTQRHELTTSKLNRLHKAAVTAQKQCGRCWPLILSPPRDLSSILKNSNHVVIVADNHSATFDSRFSDISLQAATIFIGPEGGFTTDERALFEKHNAEFWSIGETTLRSETAAVVATAIFSAV